MKTFFSKAERFLKKNPWRSPLFLVSILSLFVFPLFFINAQIPDSSIAIRVTPQIPGAYEEVVLELTSSAVDLDRSTIAWFLNDEQRLTGIGETQAKFTAGPVGSISRIRIDIISTQGQNFTKNITIRPMQVDILWEAFSYTPPFYRGKALGASAGLVLLTAMPELSTKEGRVLDPTQLVYTWEEKGVVLGSASGLGKQKIVLQNSFLPLQPMIISVKVSSFNGTVEARNTIRVPVSDPHIEFYEKHPLEGIKYSQALTGTLSIVQEELTLRGEPYFFSLDDIARDLLRFRWKINNKDINIPLSKQKNEMTFRRESGGSGKARISLDIENNNLPFRVLQSAERVLNLNFGL